MGYADLHVPDHAFDHDLAWPDMLDIVGRLRERARELGRGFGVKLTNTLVVDNHKDFFPASEPVMYLSGPPLHVIASALVAELRQAFGPDLPMSLSGGVDRHNFPDAVAAGLVPVTVCSDLLQPGGYGRASGYLQELAARMRAVSASDVPTFIARAYDPAGAGEVVANATRHAAVALADPHYTFDQNRRPPRKLPRKLARFDCTGCDKCIPVCPNTAVFHVTVDGVTHVAIVADACNDCGNCEVFCPDHGSPSHVKPRFHMSRASYDAEAPRDGVLVERHGRGWIAHARLEGDELHTSSDETAAPATPAEAELRALARAVSDGDGHHWIATSLAEPELHP